MLGTAKQFTSFAKRLAERPHGYGPLRELVRPYILRRLKTDKTVISDLPDKTEIKAFCPLSRRQAALYQQAVKDLKEDLSDLAVELPKTYVTRDDYRSDIKEIKDMLGKIFDRLEHKADK